MNLCRHCGVEVERDAERCPLCGRPLRDGGEQIEETASPRPPAVRPREANPLLRRWLLEIMSVLAAAGALVVSAVDLAYGMSLTWSRYVLASIGFLWLSGILLVVLRGRWLAHLLTEAAALGLLLWLLDRLTPGAAWFGSLALPVTLLATAMLGLTLAVLRRPRRSPLAALAIALLALGLFLPGLELVLNRHFHGRLFVSWSAVTLACVLPLVLLLLHLRRWLRRKDSEVRRLFHL